MEAPHAIIAPLRLVQVRIEGLLERLPESESDAYFASRPRGHQLGALASMQSQPLRHGRWELEERQARLEAQYADESTPVGGCFYV